MRAKRTEGQTYQNNLYEKRPIVATAFLPFALITACVTTVIVAVAVVATVIIPTIVHVVVVTAAQIVIIMANEIDDGLYCFVCCCATFMTVQM